MVPSFPTSYPWGVYVYVQVYPPGVHLSSVAVGGKVVAGQGRGGMVAAGSVVLDPCAGLPVETTWARPGVLASATGTRDGGVPFAQL